ncbi:MAG: hypothetical protein FJ137_22355 [Deltaproteobacteria bacterium]|nr:hypothetical protein [Deltaproteobacteria bacterium]
MAGGALVAFVEGHPQEALATWCVLEATGALSARRSRASKALAAAVDVGALALRPVAVSSLRSLARPRAGRTLDDDFVLVEPQVHAPMRREALLSSSFAKGDGGAVRRARVRVVDHDGERGLPALPPTLPVLRLRELPFGVWMQPGVFAVLQAASDEQLVRRRTCSSPSLFPAARLSGDDDDDAAAARAVRSHGRGAGARSRRRAALARVHRRRRPACCPGPG